jgi:hypothetical protein
MNTMNTMNTSPSPQLQVNLPVLFVKTLEDVFAQQGKLFIKEVSKTLGVDHRELIKTVFGKNNKVLLNITEGNARAYCNALIRSNHTTISTAIFCRKPAIFNTCYCQEHMSYNEIEFDKTVCEPVVQLEKWPEYDSEAEEEAGAEEDAEAEAEEEEEEEAEEEADAEADADAEASSKKQLKKQLSKNTYWRKTVGIENILSDEMPKTYPVINSKNNIVGLYSDNYLELFRITQ